MQANEFEIIFFYLKVIKNVLKETRSTVPVTVNLGAFLKIHRLTFIEIKLHESI